MEWSQNPDSVVFIPEFEQETIQENWLLAVSVHNVENLEMSSDRGYRYDRNNATAVARAVAVKQTILFPWMGLRDDQMRMLDITDLVKWEPNVHEGLQGHIKVIDIYRCPNAFFEPHKLQVVGLYGTLGGWRAGVECMVFRPNAHHILTVLCIQKNLWGDLQRYVAARW